MKPRTKLQKQVFEASRKLPKITDAQIRWASRNCIDHVGRRTNKGVITCLECGHSWQGDGPLADTITDCNCPACNTKLKVETTRRYKFHDYGYVCITTACEGFQVLRFFYVECYIRLGSKPCYSHIEVVQRWIAPNGKYATFALLRSMGCFVNGWIWASNLEIRPERELYNINPTCIYPRQKLIPEIARSGYKKPFGKLTPFDLIHTLLSQEKAETLLKTGQTALLHHFAYNNHRSIDKYWPSIRIAIRNGYMVKEASDWLDYLDLLRTFDRDLLNAKYVCPADLEAEHDRYVRKRQEMRERKRYEEQRAQALEDEKRFMDMKGKFFGIAFTDGLIDIRVLESVDEILREGEAMHHCVFANRYHLKSDSLILSARIDSERIETIEFSLSKLAVMQSRGVCNNQTEYHNRIIDLVMKNVPQIKKRLTA